MKRRVHIMRRLAAAIPLLGCLCPSWSCTGAATPGNSSLGTSRAADELAPGPQPNVDSLFSGAASFQDESYIGNDGIHEMKATQVGGLVYAYYRTYVGLPYDNCSQPAAIGLAISADGGNTFQVYNGGNPVVSMGAYGAWDDCYVIAPSVTVVNGTFYMAYEGMNHAGYVAGDIGLATSTDGINWSKQGAIVSHQKNGQVNDL